MFVGINGIISTKEHATPNIVKFQSLQLLGLLIATVGFKNKRNKLKKFFIMF
jgi:hypothetical protein